MKALQQSPSPSLPKDNRHLMACSMPALSEQELIALVLRTTSRLGGSAIEQAQQLWSYFGSLRELERCGFEELTRISGITPAKAASLQAALALGRRLVEKPLYRGQSLTSSHAVFEAYASRFGGLEQETFWLLLLDQKNRVLRQVHVASGCINRCPVTPQDIFAPALREKAVRLLLLHNHPSGNPEPSQDDKDLTQKLQQMARLLGLEIIDHLVIGDQSYVSFADRGWL